MTIERPMFPPVDQARRRFLSVAAGGATALAITKAVAAPAVDPIAQLKQLAELKDQGILTQAEFDAQKAKILAS